MLHKLFQRHATYAYHMLTDEKSSQHIFGHFMPLVVYNIFCHASFGHGIKWPKVTSGIYLPTLLPGRVHLRLTSWRRWPL